MVWAGAETQRSPRDEGRTIDSGSGEALLVSSYVLVCAENVPRQESPGR